MYHKLNLKYPPALGTSGSSLVPHGEATDETSSSALVGGLNDQDQERVAALNQSLARTVVGDEDEVKIDDIPMDASAEGDDTAKEQRKKDMEDAVALKTLFKGVKVFLNREVSASKKSPVDIFRQKTS